MMIKDKDKKLEPILISISHPIRNESIKGNWLWLGIKETFHEYALMTKVNGFYYLRKNITSGFPRFVWTVIPIMLFSLAASLVFLLWQRYIDSPTRMTKDSSVSTNLIPYPGITLCHPQSVMDFKAIEWIKHVKFPPKTTEEELLDALPSLAIFTEHQWIYPTRRSLHIIHELLMINNISVFQAIMDLGMTCEDFILNCRWAGKSFPCFQNHKYLTWKTTTSHYGACCSFNYDPNNINGEFFTTNAYEVYGALSIIGSGYPQIADGKSGGLFSAGFVVLKMMVHHPNDFAVASSPTTLLATGMETYISVIPTDSRCSDQVLLLPFRQRLCISADDFPDAKMYRQPACTLKCFRDAVHRLCGCHPYQLPRLTHEEELKRNITDCTVIEAMCFVENYYMFKKIECECYPSCADVTYETSSYTSPINANNYSIYPLYKDINLTSFEFIAHIFISNQLVAVNKKIVVMSWISLLSNLGGAFNLCLGMSCISLIEVLYFVLIRLRKHATHYYRRLIKVKPINKKFKE